MKSFKLSLFADYFQFYIQDETVTGDLSDAWNEEAVDRLLAIAPGTIGIGTVRNMDVPVVVEIRDREPDDDSSEWDHVVEASLEVTSGRTVIAGCIDYSPTRCAFPSLPLSIEFECHTADSTRCPTTAWRETITTGCSSGPLPPSRFAF